MSKISTVVNVFTCRWRHRCFIEALRHFNKGSFNIYYQYGCMALFNSTTVMALYAIKKNKI